MAQCLIFGYLVHTVNLLCVSNQDFLSSMSYLNFPLPQWAESDFFLGACYFRLVAHPNTNISLLLSDRMYLVCFTETRIHLVNTKPFETWGLVYTVQSFGACCITLSRVIVTILFSEFPDILSYKLTNYVNF